MTLSSKTWIIALILIAPWLTAHAATFSVVSTDAGATVGVPFRVDVALDTQTDTMNAVQGTISFPPGLFSLQSIMDGKSMVSFWVDPPREIASGVVEFSGIVPGGFLGQASSVIGLVLNPLVPGTGTIALENIELLKNDGQGTPLAVTSTAETVMSSAQPPGFIAPTSSISLIAPNVFTPVISQDPNIYDGRYFLVFSTSDKGSGIDYYEVLEIPTGHQPFVTSSWNRATSPYLLQDQSLSSDIYVRAVDHAGNFIIAKLPARNPTIQTVIVHHMAWVLAIVGIVLVLILSGIVLWFFRRRRIL